MRFIFLIQLLTLCISAYSQSLSLSTVIPAPVLAKDETGDFSITKKTVLVSNNSEDSLSAALFSSHSSKEYGIRLKVVPQRRDSSKAIYLIRDTSRHLPAEGYSMNISASHVTIRAGDGAGIFYALTTLKQLMPVTGSKKVTVHCGSITDYPRFPWRGMMLDVSRHFFSVNEVKQFIDYLAAYKLNTFHWHLTDDQGWRIEIKKYPLLTEVGAWRNGTLIGHAGKSPPAYDSIRYGGYYTQQQIRDVVAYAQERFINVVPEIEMPAHSLAALAAYPQLACSGDHFEVARRWSVFDDVMCPTPFSISFMQDVLSEVMDLFPSSYIHIGGDECKKLRWKESEYCQSKIKELGLKSENALQGWFTQQMDRFVESKGRHIIGWDEILTDGLSAGAAIMSWQGINGGIAAAKQHHFVVMSPTSHLYFDYYQAKGSLEPLAFNGYLPIDTVYAFDPMPSSLTADEQPYILGAQANLWTEYVPDFRQVEYMIFPRLCALAEIIWSPREKKDFGNFSQRLTQNIFPRLDGDAVNYSKAIYQLNMNLSAAANGVTVQFSSRDSSMNIRYAFTSDSSSKILPGEITDYRGPFVIDHSCQLVVTASGSHASAFTFSQRFDINKATGKSITLATPPTAKYSTGGPFTLVNGIWGRLPWHGSEWLGFLGTDLNATIELDSVQNISVVEVGLLDENGSWIYLPKNLEIFVSDDGTQYKPAGQLSYDEIKSQGGRRITFSVPDMSVRFVKVVAHNYGIIPEGNPGAGFEPWLFVDEIAVR